MKGCVAILGSDGKDYAAPVEEATPETPVPVRRPLWGRGAGS
jgi:hypothetical protein